MRGGRPPQSRSFSLPYPRPVAAETRPRPGRRSHNGFLAFGYPAAWKPSAFKIAGELHFSPVLYLSSQSLHQPCRTKQRGTVCGWPVDRLEPGGALIVWENRGYMRSM